MGQQETEGEETSYDAQQTRKMRRFLRGSAIVSGLLTIVACIVVFLDTRSGWTFLELIAVLPPAWLFWSLRPMSEKTYQRKMRAIEERRQ